jgi:hypothetical protein
MAHPPSTVCNTPPFYWLVMTLDPAERSIVHPRHHRPNAWGPECGALLTRLLRVDERGLQPLFHHEWPEAFFITGPTVPSAYPSVYTTSNRPAWLLDYVVRNYATIVPQRIRSPGTAADAQRYNVALNMPIFFVHNDRMTLGLQLVSAAAGHCVGLMNGCVTTPVGTCHTTSICIKVSESQLMCLVNIRRLWFVSSGLGTASGVLRL